MASPVRFTSGLTQAASFQPLGQIGIPDPFFYAYYEDDFIPYNSAIYTVTAATGSVAADVADGNGGRIKLANTAAASDFVSLQVPSAGFQYTAGKKLVYLTRVRISSTNTAVRIGLINVTATPFAAGLTDGIYFTVTGGTVTLNVLKASVSLGTAVVGTLTYGSDVDLGFFVDSKGNIKTFVGANLEGVKRQDFAILGPNGGILASALTSTISTVFLTPTLSEITTNSTVQSLVSDFQFAGMER